MFQWIKNWWKSLDKDKDGSSIDDIVENVKDAADINNDGAVNMKDVEAAVDVVEEKIKKTKKQLDAMTKKALEEYGRVIGVELDRRLTKAKMVAQLLKGQK